MKMEWLDIRTFDIDQYDELAEIENGDMSFVLPYKFVAFSTPYATIRGPDNSTEYEYLVPEDYFARFKKLQIKTIIRHNHKTYDRQLFVDAGFKHVDIIYTDGSCPDDDKIELFLRTVEPKGRVAVHC